MTNIITTIVSYPGASVALAAVALVGLGFLVGYMSAVEQGYRSRGGVTIWPVE